MLPGARRMRRHVVCAGACCVLDQSLCSVFLTQRAAQLCACRIVYIAIDWHSATSGRICCLPLSTHPTSGALLGMDLRGNCTRRPFVLGQPSLRRCQRNCRVPKVMPPARRSKHLYVAMLCPDRLEGRSPENAVLAALLKTYFYVYSTNSVFVSFMYSPNPDTSNPQITKYCV